MSLTQLIDGVVKDAYKKLFGSTISKFRLEYKLKKIYSRIMSYFVDSTTVTVDGISIEIILSMREYLIFRLADLGGERAVVTDFLSEIQPDDVVYDVGAFVGMYSIFAAKYGAHVVAFEPNPNNRERLQENIELNNISGIEVHPIALGRESEEIQLRSNSALDHRSQISQGESGYVVQCLRGDEFISRDDQAPPNVMKIDVEGAELSVLDGFGSTLSSCRIIYCEVHTAAVDLNKVTDKLEEYDFTTEVIHERTNEKFVKAI